MPRYYFSEEDNISDRSHILGYDPGNTSALEHQSELCPVMYVELIVDR